MLKIILLAITLLFSGCGYKVATSFQDYGYEYSEEYTNYLAKELKDTGIKQISTMESYDVGPAKMVIFNRWLGNKAPNYILKANGKVIDENFYNHTNNLFFIFNETVYIKKYEDRKLIKERIDYLIENYLK